MTAREVPASIGQRLLWFLEHYRPDTASLNCPVVCKLHGPLDVAELRTALDRLTERHESLRTTLVRRGRDLVMRVHEHAEADLTEVPLEVADDPEAVEREIYRAVTAELNTPVDVGEWPLRSTLWRLSDDEHVLCLNMHHLVSDAISCGIVMQDLIKLLETGRDATPDLPPPEWQYSRFAEWQHQQLKSGGLRKHQEYWIEHLRGMRLVPLPPPREGAVAEGEPPSAVEVADIDHRTFAKLRDVARAQRTTPFAVMLSLYYLLLMQETGQRDVSVASLFANRSMPEVRSTVGFLANMVVLRSQLADETSLVDVVRQVRATVVNAFLHESIPYQMLPLKFQDTSGRVDDVVFQMLLTPPPGTKVVARGVEFELYTPDSLGSRFTLELGLIPQHTGTCRAMLFYARNRFDDDWARRFLSSYVTLAQAAARDPEASLAQAGV